MAKDLAHNPPLTRRRHDNGPTPGWIGATRLGRRKPHEADSHRRCSCQELRRIAHSKESKRIQKFSSIGLTSCSKEWGRWPLVNVRNLKSDQIHILPLACDRPLLSQVELPNPRSSQPNPRSSQRLDSCQLREECHSNIHCDSDPPAA
jgi:hypothetical protein